MILLLLSISTLALYSQAGTTELSGEVDDLDEMRNAIENGRISQVNEFVSENNQAEIDSLFALDEDAYFTLIKENDKKYASFIREMMFKAYRNVSSLQDDLLFLDCKTAVYAQKWDMAALKANDLVRRYPNSNRKDVAVRYWKLALLKTAKDQDYVNLVEQYPEFKLASQKFQYGQSLYNIGRFDDASKYLEEAALDDNYALRATASLGLIALAQGREEEAGLIFDLLMQNFSPETPYFDFVLLSMARLFSHYDDPTTAITYYQAYNQLNENAVDDVTYEIAITHRKAGNLEKAKTYFEFLLGSKFADEYYVQALYNLVLIDQELNNGSTANQLMTNYQSRIDDYFDSLLRNRNLMNEVKTLRNNFLMENTQSRKDILLEQVRAKEEEILTNQMMLDDKISFLDARSVQLIKNLELSFIERTENYFIELDLIDQYRNRPKNELIAIANRDRINKEDGYLLSITEDLLVDIANPNDDQVLRAYWYANQIYLKKKYIVNVSSLIDKTKSYPAKNAELRGLLNDEVANLDEIKIKAKFDLAEFPDLAEKQELADQKIDEFLAAESKLEVKRKKVIDTYYETMANKAESEVVKKFSDLDSKINIYTASFNKFNNIKNEQQTYIDFIALDLEYRKLTENYRSSLSQADLESVALSEEELKGFADQYETLYQRMNGFIFRNNKFENNYKLYFNMGEIATVIYGDNYNLIYNNYLKVIDLNPNYPQRDIIIYNLAYYKNQMLDVEIARAKEIKMQDENYFFNPRPQEVTKTVSKYDEVIKYYLELSKDISSKYQIEAMLRLTKLYYDIAVDSDETAKYIGYSIKLFDQIYALGNEEQKYEALFQRAWHKMAIQNYSEAIVDLELLLENQASFSEFQKTKYNTSEDIIVYSLDALDRIPEEETKSFSYVSNSLYNKYNVEIADNIFQKILEKKRVFDSYEDIIKLYDAKSKVDPYEITNPLYTDSIIVTMSFYSVELGDSLNVRGEREYRKAIERYGYGSDWYAYNKNNDLSPYVGVIQKGLDDFVIPDIYAAVSNDPTLENIAHFSDVTEIYANYNGFNEDIRQEKLKIYQGNNISSIVKHVRANQDTLTYNYGIKEVYNYLDSNPESTNRKELEQNAYSWAFNIKVITDSTSYDSLLYTEQEIEEIKNSKRISYLNIADRFYNYLVDSNFPDKDKTIHSLLYYRGLTKYQMGNNEEAKEDFLACNDLDISDEFKESIYQNLASIYRTAGELDTSIEYFARAKEFADEEKKKEYDGEIFNNRSTKISQLSSSDSQEDKIKAAQEMEIVLNSNVVEDEKKASLRQSIIAQYVAGGDYISAIDRLIQEGDRSNEVGKAWDNYGAAVTIAADSLGNPTRAVEIEDIFMERFPTDQQTFAIMITRLTAVQDSSLATYDSDLASQKMMEIYERATRAGEKLDISSADLTPEDYYYNSVEFKNRKLSKSDQAKELIAFNQKFPDYQSVGILNAICQIYEDLGNDEEYFKFIKILYATDNTTIRYPQYALGKLSTINDNISKAFRRKNWDEMLALIEDYKTEASIHTSNGIPAESIAVTSSIERYDNYTMIYEREQEKKALLADLSERFDNFMAFIDVPADADNRIKVNNATKWNGNLSGNNKRINNFDALVQKQFELIEADADKVLNSELLSIDEVREQLYLLNFAEFKIAQYAGDMIYKQIKKYLELPRGQYVAYQRTIFNRTELSFEEQDEILYAYEDDILNTQNQYVYKFDDISIGYGRALYDNYINGFTNQQPRSDEVIAYLQKRNVYEVVPKDEMNITFEPTWRRDFSAITETVINDGYRDFMVYTIPSGDSLHLETTIDCPILPMAARMRFVDEGKFWNDDNITLSLKINDNAVNIDELYFQDGVIDDSLSTFPYLYRGLINDDNASSLNYQKGRNVMTLTVVNNSLEKTNIGFNYSMIYDQEKLYIHNNSIIVSVVSDNSWLGADSLRALDIEDPNWSPVDIATLDVAYNQLSSFTSSMALPIWVENKDLDLNALTETNDIQEDIAISDIAELSDSLKNNVDTLGVEAIQVATADDSVAIEIEPKEDTPTVKYFIKEFDISGKVVEGIIYFLANETANVYLNGVQIGYDEYYYFTPPDAPYLDVRPEDFIPGKNVIIFEVNSPTKNNGLLVDIKVRTLNERR